MRASRIWAWGERKEWDATYEYFDRASNAVVLPRLVYRFEHGPIDWAHPPESSPVVASMKVELVASDPRNRAAATPCAGHPEG